MARGKGDTDAYQGDGELSGRGGGKGIGGTREPGLGEILRGLRAMARVKRARVCTCMCTYVCARTRAHTHAARTHTCRVYTRITL